SQLGTKHMANKSALLLGVLDRSPKAARILATSTALCSWHRDSLAVRCGRAYQSFSIKGYALPTCATRRNKETLSTALNDPATQERAAESRHARKSPLALSPLPAW